MNTNEANPKNISGITLADLARLCASLEARIAHLEKMHNQVPPTATDKRYGSPVPTNGFDLEAYREMLRIKIRNCEGTKNIRQENWWVRLQMEHKIEAFQEALNLTQL